MNPLWSVNFYRGEKLVHSWIGPVPRRKDEVIFLSVRYIVKRVVWITSDTPYVKVFLELKEKVIE